MSVRMISAPGKIVLSGEYAVLAGAPAVAMAVNRRAIVSLDAATDGFFSVTTPGYVDGAWRFLLTDSGVVEWQESPPPPGQKLLEAAFAAVDGGQIPPLSITIDTRAFFDPATGVKLGLGSSAAAMTALIWGMNEFANCQREMNVATRQAHMALQNGVGSGVDVATSLRGGVVAYRKNEQAESTPLFWPENLSCRVFWSGQSAATADRIRKLGPGSPDEKIWRPLQRAANAVLSTWSDGKANDVLRSLQAYAASLKTFSDACDLGVFAAGHEILCELADGERLVYKPCGAGGGDIGVAFSDDESKLDHFAGLAVQNGFTDLPLTLDERGVHVSPATNKPAIDT